MRSLTVHLVSYNDSSPPNLILQPDPLHLVRRRPPKRNQPLSGSSDEASGKLARERSIKSNRRQRFVDCVTQEDVNMGMSYFVLCFLCLSSFVTDPTAQLRKLAWNGVPNDLRPIAWPLLLVWFYPVTFLSELHLNDYAVMQGYMPLPAPLRASTLARKRQEYSSLVELAFARNREGLDQQIWHQIEIDVPRTRPGVQLWMHASTQRVRPYRIFSLLPVIRY